MKILALNSSPRTDSHSKTKLLLCALTEGMSRAGGHVERVDLRKKKIRQCIGCFTCWTKTPGVCVQKDDMSEELFAKWMDADLIVYATPVYHWMINALMKTFIERTIPGTEPFFVKDGERWKHPLRHKDHRYVALAVAAFPEDEVFSQVSSYFRFVFGEQLVAEIYRSASEMIVQSTYRDMLDDILKATERAGEELVRSLAVTPETRARITQPVGDFGSFAQTGNAMWKTCIAEGITPQEMEKQEIVPRPDSAETFMLIMKMAFSPEEAADANMTIQFVFAGENPESCFFVIANGTCVTHPGTVDNPDLTIEAPFDVWMDVITGKVDGQQMFDEGICRVGGDFFLLAQMNRLFGA
jgi:putative sterol carrier protein/putative NADPH-quinone reductase